MRTIPVPVMSWEDVVRLNDPIRKPTRERMRRLRRKDIISEGVHVHPRRSGRNAGSAVYYSALNAIAAQLDRFGDVSNAARFCAAAADIEWRFSDPLKTWLSTNLISDLHAAPFYAELVTATETAISDLRVHVPRSPGYSVTTGRIAELDRETALVEVKRHRGVVLLEIGADMVSAAGAHLGDSLWVTREYTGPTALITVMLAVDTTSGGGTWDLGKLPGDHHVDEDEDEDALANEFHQGIGKRPTAEQMQQIRKRSANHPTHRISLVG